MKIRYIATEDSEWLPAGRTGLQHEISVLDDGDKLTDISIPKEVESVEVARVGDNTVEEVTVKGDGYRTMDIVIAHAIDARWPLWNEFHRSTRKREEFTIDPNGQLRNHTFAGTYRCVRTSKTAPEYFNNCSGIKYRFTVEIKN